MQDANCWITAPRYIFNPDTDLVSVHQPSRKALELSAGRGCRVCALFWFQLFYDAGAAHARRDNDLEVAPILLSMQQPSWDRDLDIQYPTGYQMQLRHGERLALLWIYKPISGTTNGDVL